MVARNSPQIDEVTAISFHPTKLAADTGGGDIEVLALVRGEQKYVFFYSDTKEGKADLLRTLGRFASNADLSFTWHDAALLSAKVRGLPAEIKKG